MSMYQPQAHYTPANQYPQANSSSSASQALHYQLSTPTDGVLPIPQNPGQNSSFSITQQSQPMYPHSAPQMVRSAARSMPTGHGYLNGSTLPDYPGGSVASSLVSQHQMGQHPIHASQRHNSGVGGIGSTDNLAAQAGHHPSLQHLGSSLTDSASQHSIANAQNPQQQQQQSRAQSYFVNTVEQDLSTPMDIKAYAVRPVDGSNGGMVDLRIRGEKVFDRGAFGTVFKARILNEDNRLVAVKSVIQDKRYRNRELPLMKNLSHTNIVILFYYYFSAKSQDPRAEKCLNLVMEFMPGNVSHLIPRKPKRDPNAIPTTPLTIKLVMFQIFRALSYIHSCKICHRDIKPNNLLFNPETGVLKVCDFGSAKQLNPGERNVSYICARYYRAPELLFGATDYTNMIDLWSTGIVFSELLLGYPIFHENSGIDQLVNIISKLGTPTREQILAMNKDYVKYNLPEVPAVPLEQIFHHASGTPTQTEALNLIKQLFQYDPAARIKPLRACAHPYFDELREPGKKWVNGHDLPPLFNFESYELATEEANDPDLIRRLLPQSTRTTVTPLGARTPNNAYLHD